jgi:hypothetical protein
MGIGKNMTNEISNWQASRVVSNNISIEDFLHDLSKIDLQAISYKNKIFFPSLHKASATIDVDLLNKPFNLPRQAKAILRIELVDKVTTNKYKRLGKFLHIIFFMRSNARERWQLNYLWAKESKDRFYDEYIKQNINLNEIKLVNKLVTSLTDSHIMYYLLLDSNEKLSNRDNKSLQNIITNGISQYKINKIIARGIYELYKRIS